MREYKVTLLESGKSIKNVLTVLWLQVSLLDLWQVIGYYLMLWNLQVKSMSCIKDLAQFSASPKNLTVLISGRELKKKEEICPTVLKCRLNFSKQRWESGNVLLFNEIIQRTGLREYTNNWMLLSHCLIFSDQILCKSSWVHIFMFSEMNACLAFSSIERVVMRWCTTFLSLRSTSRSLQSTLSTFSLPLINFFEMFCALVLLMGLTPSLIWILCTLLFENSTASQ